MVNGDLGPWGVVALVVFLIIYLLFNPQSDPGIQWGLIAMFVIVGVGAAASALR